MPYAPSFLQVAILRTLEYLQVQGCPSADESGKPIPPKIRFGLGVPEVFLRACVLASDEALKSATRPLLIRQLIRQEKGQAWVTMSRKHRFAAPGGGVVELEFRRADPEKVMRSSLEASGVKFKVATKGKKHRKQVTELLWNVFEARVGVRIAQDARVLVFSSASKTGFGAFISVTARGLDLLDTIGDVFEPDTLVRLSQVAPLTGLSKRTLERHVARGILPAPDVRGGQGRAHKWYWSNLRSVLAKISRKRLPDRFPGSCIE